MIGLVGTENRGPLMRIFAYPGPLWPLWSIVGVVYTLVSLFTIANMIVVMRFLRLPRAWVSNLIHAWARSHLWVCGVKLVVEGAEIHDVKAPCLVVSNHQSLFDIPGVYASIRGNIRMLAKRELAYIPFFGWGMRAAEFVLVQRAKPEDRKAAADKISRRLHSGLQVWLAPEGTRSRGLEMGPFKSGSFALAIDAGIPVQPIVFLNNFELLPKGSLWIRAGLTVYAKVLPAHSTRGLTADDRVALAERVRGAMQAALAEMASRFSR